MDAFFAAVEQKRHPELAGKPVVIGGSGDPTKRGVVSTASYEARKFGIHSAMPLRAAFKLCPHAVFLPVDYEEYSRVSEIIKNILREFSPIMEDVGIDEAFLDIYAGLACPIGIAPDSLCHNASGMQKPNSSTIMNSIGA